MIGIDTPLIERCVGLPMASGKGVGVVGTLLALPCSVFLLGGSWWERSLFAALVLTLPFAIINYRWGKRHDAYWNKVRARETERRRERKRD